MANKLIYPNLAQLYFAYLTVKYSFSCISLLFGNCDPKGQGQTSILNVKSDLVKNKNAPFHGRFKCRQIKETFTKDIALYFVGYSCDDTMKKKSKYSSTDEGKTVSCHWSDGEEATDFNAYWRTGEPNKNNGKVVSDEVEIILKELNLSFDSDSMLYLKFSMKNV